MKMIQDTYQTLVFSDASLLPKEAIRLTSLTSDVAEQNASRQAICSGRIQGYKIVKSMKDLTSGALYVNTEHGEAYLKHYRKYKEESPKKTAVVVQATESNDETVKVLRELLAVQKQMLTRLTSIDDFCAKSAIGIAQFIAEARAANREAPSVSNGTHEFTLNSR